MHYSCTYSLLSTFHLVRNILTALIVMGFIICVGNVRVSEGLQRTQGGRKVLSLFPCYLYSPSLPVNDKKIKK